MPTLQTYLQKLTAYRTFSILALIVANVIIGLFTFKDYGFSYDEPLFYGYADAIGYAYTPSNWFSPDFDITKAYGPSAWDHGNRGPAYLLIARFPAHLLQALGVDQASAWHLVNFLFFQIGVYFFFVLCLRWMKPWAAFAATIFFSTQPILWEHAFINPKDPPFLVLFLVSLELGFRMADRLAHPAPDERARQTFKAILLPAIVLGLATNVRVLAPLAAALAGIYFLFQGNLKRIYWFIPYGIVAYLTMVITWPYLWANPITKFIEAVTFFSYNPTELRVYFYGQLYRANELPLRYLSAVMLYTLTEPVWFLAGIGFIVATVRTIRRKIDWQTLFPTLGWFAIPFLYVLVKRPPMYDGFRHFLFIAPPLFVLGGLTIDAIFQWVRSAWFRSTLTVLLILPGVIPGIQLHPYEYTYYNQFVGGTGQAAYRFETDYWLTCYKEIMEQFNASAAQNHPTLFVDREYYIAAYYADPRIDIRDFTEEKKDVKPGDYRLLNSRADPGLQRYRDPKLWAYKVGRDGAIFCVIQKQ